MKNTDRAILIHRSPYSNSSLITTFYTEQRGLQKFIFKGGKKKAYSLFPLAATELTFYGRNKDLLNLTIVDSLFPTTFQFNPIKSSIAFFIAEVVQKCVIIEDADTNIFRLLQRYSFELNENDEVQLFPLQFLIDFSDVLGFLPLRENTDAKIFNIDTGRFQYSLSNNLRTFKGESIDLLIRLIEKSTLPFLPTKEVRDSAMNVYLNYFSVHIPKFTKLESLDILKEVLSE